ARRCASPAPPPSRTPPDVPARRSPASCADAPAARGHDAPAEPPAALPSSPAQIACSGGEPPRKSLRHRRHPACCACCTPSRILPESAAPPAQPPRPRAPSSATLHTPPTQPDSVEFGGRTPALVRTSVACAIPSHPAHQCCYAEKHAWLDPVRSSYPRSWMAPCSSLFDRTPAWHGDAERWPSAPSFDHLVG